MVSPSPTVYYTAFEGVDPSCFACDDVSDDSMDIEEDIPAMVSRKKNRIPKMVPKGSMEIAFG